MCGWSITRQPARMRRRLPCFVRAWTVSYTSLDFPFQNSCAPRPPTSLSMQENEHVEYSRARRSPDYMFTRRVCRAPQERAFVPLGLVTLGSSAGRLILTWMGSLRDQAGGGSFLGAFASTTVCSSGRGLAKRGSHITIYSDISNGSAESTGVAARAHRTTD